MNTYYFILASKKFLLEEEPIEEMLRERTNFYLNHNIEPDFWIVNDASQIIANDNNIPRNIPSSIAIVSTNKTFIDWIKLRITHVYSGKMNKQDLAFK
uniref:Conserved hypothetical plastid protein n=1 Tax=Bulboplastis apyrenoidosa TaxID=1070855 RepID=A0A1Y9TM57_9RHOD|nr:conserved hypothetical plastid protein [Bulboplastis apyrenoidosa]ARO90708.1 conserved hypothetical plastid protein [Bulboplastis apyrenoidosa]